MADFEDPPHPPHRNLMLVMDLNDEGHRAILNMVAHSLVRLGQPKPANAIWTWLDNTAPGAPTIHVAPPPDQITLGELTQELLVIRGALAPEEPLDLDGVEYDREAARAGFMIPLEAPNGH